MISISEKMQLERPIINNKSIDKKVLETFGALAIKTKKGVIRLVFLRTFKI